MKIYYGGHSSFMLESKGKIVMIDPFSLSEEMKQAKPDVIAVSHAHGDHIGSAMEIAREKQAPLMAVYELSNYFHSQGLETIDGHIGGKIKFDFGWIKFVNALHASSLEEDGRFMGNPCGFVVNMHGTTVYHTGDTGLFGDMALIAEMTPIDVFLCPIGDKFTMGPDDAVKAVKLVLPAIVVPMHYDTFPPISQDASLFKSRVESEVPSVTVEIMKPGDAFSLDEEE